MKNQGIADKIGDWNLKRKLKRAIDIELGELGVWRYLDCKKPTEEKGKFESLYFSPDAMQKFKQDIRRIKKEKRNYKFDIILIGRKEEVAVYPGRDGPGQYGWRHSSDNSGRPYGYTILGKAANPEEKGEMQIFKNEVLKHEKSGEILPGQIYELLEAMVKTTWEKKTREPIERNCSEELRRRWHPYEQIRLQQMMNLGITRPSNTADIYVRIVSEKK